MAKNTQKAAAADAVTSATSAPAVVVGGATTVAAAAAAAFADGFVAPVAPAAGPAISSDPFGIDREAERATLRQDVLDAGFPLGRTVAPVGAGPAILPDTFGEGREADRATLRQNMLDDAGDTLGRALDQLADGHILLICSQAGFRRGDMEHPPRAEYPLNAFTQEQLDAFAHEPRLQLVAIGGEPIARPVRLFGGDPHTFERPIDSRLAGEAVEAAISRPPNRSEAGMRNAAAGRTPAGFVVR